MIRITWLLLITLLLPSVAWGLDFDWTSDQNDRSIYYLGMLFGQVGTVLPGAIGNEIIGEILRIFNITVLTVGTIVVVYSTLVTTLSTAQEGEVMGKKWSSVWLPIRSATGLAFLLPTASGFSLIQILMMWIIVQGIHGANQIWSVILDKAISGQGLTSTMKIKDNDAVETSIKLFSSLVCMHRLNNHEAFKTLTGGDEVSVYYPASTLTEIWIGVQDNSAYKKVCGVAKPSAKHKKASNQNQWNRQQLAAIEIAYLSLDGYAEEAAIYPNDKSEWTGLDIIKDAARSMKGPITNVDMSPVALPNPILVPNIISGPTLDTNEMFRLAKEDGWIHAGGYYFKLIDATGAQDYKLGVPKMTKSPMTQDTSGYPYPDGDPESLAMITAKAAAYLSHTEAGVSGTGNISNAQISLQSPDLSSEAKDAMGDSMSGFTALMRAFISHLTERDVDPIASFEKTGSEILLTVEIIFFALVIGLPILMAIACLMSGMQPACYVLGVVIVIFFPVLVVVLSLLWSAGVAIGIYLPLVPFFIYTFTALGWIMLVVETIVAAPIVALGITAPGQEALGKASPAVMLITNVFLRPSLIVIGFIASARLVKPVISMVNYGFESFVLMNVGFLLLFGNIALIIIYAGVAIAAIHQVFSLTYVLADKVIRWIGGQAEQSMVEKAMDETKKASDSAASSTGAIMKGAAENSLKYAKMAMEKAQEMQGTPDEDLKDDGGDTSLGDAGEAGETGSSGGGLGGASG
jgi:conjugal transfer/type IV secretion protein DotA/TraY